MISGDWILPAVVSALFVLLGLVAFALDEFPPASRLLDRFSRAERDLDLWEAELEADRDEAL